MAAKNTAVKTPSYRDRVYTVKDIIIKLVGYGEMNQTAFRSLCGLNMNKHRSILGDLDIIAQLNMRCIWDCSIVCDKERYK